MRSGLAGLVAAASLLAAAYPASAQSWRTVTKVRHIAGEERLNVEVSYGAGEFRLQPAETGVLYRMRLRYDEDSFEPVAELSGTRLRLGVRSLKSGIRGLKGERGGELELAIARGLPLDLDVEMGATRSSLELGGLALSTLELSAGASETTVAFSDPNPVRARLAKFEVGAASFHARGLGNLNAERIRVQAGVGDVTLDFAGDWREDTNLDVEMGLGSLTLRFPRGLGVRIVKDTFLASLDSEGLIKQGDAFLSPDWEAADQRLTVHVKAALGSIDVRWLP
ncbi:MAG: hypothetical protein HY704_14530 [Gemmatimonadetes bacterium]|nr:hypothetical protein [Gemmatimonadota bacterium]